MGYPVNPDGSFDYDHPLKLPTTLTDERAGYDAPIKCPRCDNRGYIWVAETPDTGHDYQMNCPVCNPKVDLYAADRYDTYF